MEPKRHWEQIYKTKSPGEVSWTQEIPETSLEFIRSFQLSKKASIIDVGGGDSKLVDFLLDEGFEDVTVLDISGAALDRAKQRMGIRAKKVKWVVSDITAFHPDRTYEVWHDRAAFHFLTTERQISKYLQIARKSVRGFMTIGTFSENGPAKCSGLQVRQYSETQLVSRLSDGFDKIRCVTEDHVTPSKIRQNFVFCSFKRVNTRNSARSS